MPPASPSPRHLPRPVAVATHRRRRPARVVLPLIVGMMAVTGVLGGTGGAGAAVGVLMRLPQAAHSERVRRDARRAEMRGRIEEALGFWRHALALDGADLEPWLRCARLAARLGRHREAREAYRSAMELSAARRWRDAQLTTYEEVTHTYPDSTVMPALEFALARREEEAGRFEIAAAHFRRGSDAAEDATVRATGYVELARLHRDKTGDWVAAADAEEDAVRVVPALWRARTTGGSDEVRPPPPRRPAMPPYASESVVPHEAPRAEASGGGTISP